MKTARNALNLEILGLVVTLSIFVAIGCLGSTPNRVTIESGPKLETRPTDPVETVEPPEEPKEERKTDARMFGFNVEGLIALVTFIAGTIEYLRRRNAEKHADGLHLDIDSILEAGHAIGSSPDILKALIESQQKRGVYEIMKAKLKKKRAKGELKASDHSAKIDDGKETRIVKRILRELSKDEPKEQ